MRIEVAEHCIELRVTKTLLPAARAHYGLFATDKPPEITLDITVSENTTTADGPWGECAYYNNFLHFFDDYSIGWCDFARAQGGLYVLPSTPLNPLGSFLRSIYMVLVMRNGGICLHAAAILHQGEVFIFVGPSGAGKSTVARLSAGKTVLSDELIFIKKQGAEYLVFPGPQWTNTQIGTYENKPYPIRGIFKLVQDKTVFIEPLGRASVATADLFTIPDILFFLASKETLLSTYMDIIDKVECCKLHFLPEPSFWGHIERALPLKPFGKESAHGKYHAAQIG